MDLPSMAAALGLAWSPAAVPIPPPVPVSAAVEAPGISAAPGIGRGRPVYDDLGDARSWDEAMDDLASASIVAVGETHPNPEHHRVQAEVLTALAARTPRLAVAFEMVGFEEQDALDAYMDGSWNEERFAAWWKSHWGYDFSLYRPIFAAAKAAYVPAYGINAPHELVRAVARGGLSSLSPSDRARLPAEIRESDDARYRAFVDESLASHGPLTPEQLKNRREAMAVWNETMGERAAALAAEGYVVLVVAGEGHVLFKAGLVESAARRGAGPAKILLPLASAPGPEELPLADWFSAPLQHEP